MRIHLTRHNVLLLALSIVVAVEPVIAQTGGSRVVANEIVHLSGFRDSYPFWSPDGQSIVFESNRAGNHDIWVMNADGSDVRRLTDHPALDETPVFSPDGGRIVFASEREGELDVFSMRADGSDLVNLTRNPTADDDHPKFSRDGRLIAFNSKRHDGETYQLWVMNADGTHPRRITEHIDWDTFPSFSSDGSRILFRRVLPTGGWSSSGRDSEIFVIDADGYGARNLSRHPAFDGYPDWSHDGRFIAFASDREARGVFQVYVMDADGSNVVRISPAETGASYARPIWSPDSRRIVATREKDEVREIIVFELAVAFGPAVLFTREVAIEPVTDGGLSRGVAWGDFDGDGDPDLVVANAINQPQMLYRNDGPDGFFQIQWDPIVQGAGDTEGVFWADYDNDGDLDILLTNQFDQPLRLFRNDGPATAEADGSAGFTLAAAGELGDDRLGSANGACWGDYDNDGDLDVFVVHREGLNDELYRNQGDGTFRRVTEGVAVNNGGDGRTCACGDVDDDGDLDLFVGNFRDGDTKATNFFYLNRGDGSFDNVTEGTLVTDRQATYGSSFVDADEDGDLDLFLSNISRTDHNALYINDGRGQFAKRTDGSIVTADSRPSKGHAWGDYDNDGDLDLFIANGTEADVDLRNFLYLNDGHGRFTAVTVGDLVNDVTISAGAAWADFDADGDLDLFVANWGGSDEDNALYRNQTYDRHWLVVRLVGQRSNRMGLGARVRARARIDGDDRWQTRWLLPATGYASQNEPIVHFGLGDATRVETLEVRWPSGVVDVLEGVGVDDTVEVVEGQEQRR
jgi:Tol biopolymer transport system component